MAERTPAGRILVGRFGAPHGVRGEVRLQSFTQDPKAIGGFGPLSTRDGRVMTLKSLRLVRDAMLVVQVDGVADRTAAQALTGLELHVERDRLPPPDEEEFYVADLIGLEAVDRDGSALGTIVDVPNYGGGDLVEIRTGETTLLLPFTKEVVPVVDIAARQVTVVMPQDVDGEDAVK